MNIPDHELVCQVGQGSYGEVWLVRSVMGRFRAAKFIFRKTFREAHPFQRELAGIQQFEPVSRSHPGFVHVLHVGRNDAEEYFYYLMEPADDVLTGQQINPAKYTPKTLSTEIARRGRLPVADAVQWAKQLAGALAHLHEKGLVHRDIKPSNIVFVENAPKFADIGLVTSIADARSYVGTEGFIPPEGPGSEVADIFSLGKVLYEAATGKDRLKFPELPDNFGAGADAQSFLELNEVILKACDPERSRRYQNAREMLAELDLLQAGRSVRRARKQTILLKRGRQAAVAAVVVAALAAAIYYPARSQRAQEAVRHREAVHAELTRADASMRIGSYLEALPFYFRALRLDHDDPLRAESHRLRIASALAHGPRLANMWFLPRAARRVEISNDGRRILLVDDQIEVKEIDSGKSLSTSFGPPGLRDACFSPDGERILTAGLGGVAIWNLEGRELARFPHEGEVSRARFSPDGQRIITASADGLARIWNVPSQRVDFILQAHRGAVNYACFSANGELAATAGADGKALLWDARSGMRVGAEMIHAGPVNQAAFSPDGRRLATACEDGTARLWRSPGGEDTAGTMRHEAPVRSVAFSPDGRLILTASNDSKAQLWQASLGIPAPQNPALRNSSRLAWAAFDPTGRRIVTAALDGAVRLWDLSNRSPKPAMLSADYRSPDSADMAQFPLVYFLANSLQVSLSMDGRNVVALSADKSKTLEVKLTHSASLESIYFAGKRLAHVRAREIQIYQPDAPVETLSMPGEISDFSISPNGTSISVATGPWLQRWELSTRREPLRFATNIQQVTYGADGQRLLVCLNDSTGGGGRAPQHTAFEVDSNNGSQLRGPFPHLHRVAGSYVYPDRQRALVVGSRPNTFRIWDSQDGEPATTAVEYPPNLSTIYFFPDAKSVLGVEGNGERAWHWSLEIDAHREEDLRLLCGLLASDWIDAAAGRAEIESAWARMSGADPKLFAAAPEDIFAWHERQAQDSRAEKNWAAALFHLRKLRSLAPGNDLIEEQIKAAEAAAAR